MRRRLACLGTGYRVPGEEPVQGPVRRQLACLLSIPVTALTLPQDVECGDSCLINWLEEFVADVWAMVSRGATVTMMVLWQQALDEQALLGTPAAEVGGQLSFFYACTLTFLGATLSAWLEALEDSLRALNRRDERAAGRGQGAGLPTWSLQWRESAILFSDLVQMTIGYVVGSSWSALAASILPSLSMQPSPSAVGENALIAIGFTLAVTAWFIAAGACAASDSVAPLLTPSSLLAPCSLSRSQPPPF